MTGTEKSPALAAELCCFPCSDSFPVFHYSAGTGQKKERAAKMLPCRCNLDARSLVLYNEYEGVFTMSRDSIKMVAMLTMLIKHIANVFLPAGQPLTNLCLCIGYFTAVTMCFFLVEGYGCTRYKRRYAGRLLGFAVLAQLPYQLAFPANGIAGFVQFIMLFTLLLCFLVLLVQEKIQDRVLRGVCIVLLLCASLFCDWALLAPLFTLLFAWAGGIARGRKPRAARRRCSTAAWPGWAAGRCGRPSAALCRSLSPRL